MSHTPGPWKTGKREDDSRWLSIGDPSQGPHYQGDLVCSDADALLIIAAPQLLESLEALVVVVRSLPKDYYPWREEKAARAAIAAAKEGK